MATVHNAYYNSPWIADAARNLASALAPPDPQVALDRQLTQFKFEQAQKEAMNADLEREDEALARQDLGALAEFQPIRGPDGKIDRQATITEARRLYASAIKHRADPKLANVVAGPISPDFAAKSELAQYGFDARLGYLGAQLAGNRQLAEFNQGEQSKRYFAGLANARTLQDMRSSGAFQLEMQKQRGRLEVAKQRAAATGKPMKISDSDLEMITYLIGSKMDQTGKKLYGTDMDRLVDAAIDAFQATGNPAGAVNMVWDTTLPGTNERPNEARSAWDEFWNNEDEHLAPDFSKLGAGAPRTLGGAATQTPAPALAPPAAAPAPSANVTPMKSGAPPVRLLKEGVETTFKGKGTWTLKNGVPTRVK